jgi:hypothetical protein
MQGSGYCASRAVALQIPNKVHQRLRGVPSALDLWLDEKALVTAQRTLKPIACPMVWR